ncbi:MAG: hypothetical protein AABW91_04620 [Nanoarchaeota archaeon]|mgnify:CR=1 FL=1
MKSQREETENKIGILTCTTEVYIASQEKKPSDYIFGGVIHPDIKDKDDYDEMMQRVIKLGVEVITDLRPCDGGGFYATMLIPKSHVLG